MLSGCCQKLPTVLRLWASISRLQVHIIHQYSGPQLIALSEIWSEQREHQRAAELFERAGISYTLRAVEEYYKAKIPGVALNLLLRGGHYVQAVDGLTQ